MSIDRDILFAQVAARSADTDALWLAKVLIYHDCTEDYVYKGPAGMHAQVPPHKTLFGAPKNKGLPIGNLNSQFFANVYLTDFDRFIKHTLKCRHYLRYCDDFVLLAPEREKLADWHGRITEYLRGNLRLDLNAKRTRFRPVSDGVDFVGYITRRDYLLLRRRVVSKLKAKLREYKTDLVHEDRSFRRYAFDEERLDKLFATLCSYLGHSKIANTYYLWRSLWERETWLGQYFKFDLDERKLTRTYKAPRWLRRTVQQYRYYRWRFRGDVVLIQVGCFFEFYDERDHDIARLLGLTPIGANARGARYGFPVRLTTRYLRKILRDGRSVTAILESKSYLTGIQVRLPGWRLETMSDRIRHFTRFVKLGVYPVDWASAEESDDCSCPLLHRRFQASSFSGRLATLTLRNEAENRFACAAARVFALQGFASEITPTHACSATCRTGNLQDILLSEY